jgi:septation ring formation regulator EzrA
MTDENANTADLTINEKLDRILSRLEALEAKADDRANTTRPLLDQLVKEMVQTRETLTERIGAVEKELRSINHRLAIFSEDINRVRGEMRDIDSRVDELERRPN